MGKLRKIEVPELKDRVETGPLQINDDWPGLFIRGDNSFSHRTNLSIIRRKIKSGQTITPDDMINLERVMELLESALYIK